MESHLITVDGSEPQVTPENVKCLLESSACFCLDLAGLDQDTATGLLGGTFGFHQLAVKDAEQFGQRPKLDSYDLLVVYGAAPAGHLVEVHCFYNANYLVTVHREPSPDLTALADRVRHHAGRRPDHVMLLYQVLDAPTSMGNGDTGIIGLGKPGT